MDDPIEQLIEEHRNILRGIHLLEITGKMASDNEIPSQNVEQLLSFFKLYADDGHHAKEEKILFTQLYMKDEGLRKESSPLTVLTEQHVTGRELVSKLSRLDTGYQYHVEDYASLLRRHIDIEDEVFPVLASDYFSDEELVKLFNDFQFEDSQRDLNASLKLLDIIEMELL